MPQRESQNTWQSIVQPTTSSTIADGVDLCQRDGSLASWRDLGRRVLSEASRLAKEEARRAAMAAQQTTEGPSAPIRSDAPSTRTTTPVPHHLNQEASS